MGFEINLIWISSFNPWIYLATWWYLTLARSTSALSLYKFLIDKTLLGVELTTALDDSHQSLTQTISFYSTDILQIFVFIIFPLFFCSPLFPYFVAIGGYLTTISFCCTNLPNVSCFREKYIDRILVECVKVWKNIKFSLQEN